MGNDTRTGRPCLRIRHLAHFDWSENNGYQPDKKSEEYQNADNLPEDFFEPDQFADLVRKIKQFFREVRYYFFLGISAIS